MLSLRARGKGLVALLLTVLAACSSPPTSRAPESTTVPDHVMVVVFDQMRPDYIDRFDLRNFQRLRASARNYPEAYVGHLGSQTVVSHLVISSGLLPKMLPWQDDVVVDKAGALGKPNAAYETGRLSREQLWTLLKSVPSTTYLPYRIRVRTGRKVIAIGEKDYAALVMGTPTADAIVTLTKRGSQCVPSGVNVPDYIAGNGRFTVECVEPYGTGLTTVYALDGSHYVPGDDSEHLGGDVWTTDVALEVMAREDWAGLFLTFGGIDKVAHMLGEQDGPGLSVPSRYRLADVARIADEQLGRLLGALEDRGLLERTVIAVMADHGGQTNRYYLGNNKYQSCCPLENSEAPVDPPYWIKHLTELGKLHTSYQDTSVKIWLADRSAINEMAIVQGMSTISGMVEIYALRRADRGWRYERVFTRLTQQEPAFQRWANQHDAELMDTMAAEAAPHLVGLLADGFGFGRIGDHGGAQERAQRIPFILRVPGEGPSTRSEPIRLVDVEPKIADIMHLQSENP